MLEDRLEPLVDPVPGHPELDYIVEYLNKSWAAEGKHKVKIVSRSDLPFSPGVGPALGYIDVGVFHFHQQTPIYTMGAEPEHMEIRRRAEYLVVWTSNLRMPIKISLDQFKFTDWKELNGYQDN